MIPFQAPLLAAESLTSKYTESILKGTDPVLKNGLIPVMIDEKGVVIKASEGWEWYDYETRQWANAVILNDESVNYQYGEVIPESNIESYFVWIPRYKYKLFDENNGIYTGLTTVFNNTETIDIQFGMDTTGDTDITCKTPMKSGESGTCSKGKYMTHPAFISFDTKGIWVGKFETGYKGATNASEAQVNEIENGLEKIQIKPNVYSWRDIRIATSYTYSYEYKRELVSHMMKNTEWGAVAYLQHSEYGSQMSIRINNHMDHLTGYSALKEPTCGYTGTNDECNKYGETLDITQPWNTDIGKLASTTGNISGIYDMSGGAWEHMMGVMVDNVTGKPCSGKSSYYNSGFNGLFCEVGQTGLTDGIAFPIDDEKYYDIYLYDTTHESYYRRILGDATGEMGPFYLNNQDRQVGSWYKDDANFIFPGDPWFGRGSHFNYGASAGIFAFNDHNGRGSENVSFRIVLAFS